MLKTSKVIMVCGISGSGKTRLAKLLEFNGIPRLSIDEELWPDFYVYSDFLTAEHKDHLYAEAVKRIVARMGNFCAENRICSVDMPFCHRQQRQLFCEKVRAAGGEPVLVWLKADLPVLKKRLADRKGKNGPNNLPVTEEEIERYWRGFEPITECECTVINSNKGFDLDAVLELIK